MNRSEATQIVYLDPHTAGRSLQEVGVDYLKVETQEITSRWFHGIHDVDLFLWQDQHGQIIKQQISFCGQIVEWNILDGLKTGVVVEEEMGTDEKSQPPTSESIRFDNLPQTQAVETAKQVIAGALIEEMLKGSLLSNLGVRGLKLTLPRVKINLFQSILEWFKKRN